MKRARNPLRLLALFMVEVTGFEPLANSMSIYLRQTTYSQLGIVIFHAHVCGTGSANQHRLARISQSSLLLFVAFVTIHREVDDAYKKREWSCKLDTGACPG